MQDGYNCGFLRDKLLHHFSKDFCCKKNSTFSDSLNNQNKILPAQQYCEGLWLVLVLLAPSGEWQVAVIQQKLLLVLADHGMAATKFSKKS